MPATCPLKDLEYFLVDMDGTVYLGQQAIAGAPEWIQYLRQSGRHCLFLTNNSSADAQAYCEKLSRLGIEADIGQILTSGQAAALHLAMQTRYRRIFAVGPPSFEEELRRQGLEVVSKDPEAVVIGFDKTLTYAKLEQACHFLRQGLPYWATNPDRMCPTDTGGIPDCGAIAACLEAATGCTPQYIGKPNPAMARAALARIGGQPERAAMVGDRLYTDIAMARAAGITGILVLSGETTEAMLESCAEPPDYVFRSVRELHAALLDADGASQLSAQ